MKKKVRLKTLSLRAHHVEMFVEALLNKEYKEKWLSLEGAFHSEEETRRARELLNLVTDQTKVRIVLGQDDLCKICAEDEEFRRKWKCSKPDYIWDGYNLLNPFELVSRLTVTIGFLKERHWIVEKYGSVENWRREKRFKK